MAESKIIFNQGKQNRDIDARLLPPGQYRDALNVNVGESEGGDIGALENVKGNSLVQGQTGIAGTTIGVVKDPNNDNVYWFNTGTTNAIYEYNQSENRVRTILSDKASRTAPEPTCAPDTVASITTPDGNAPTRPTLPTIPDPPLAYCGEGSATNTNQRADGSAADTAYDYVDNTICVFPPPESYNCDGSFNCVDPGDGSGTFSTLADCQNNCTDPGGGGGGGIQIGITCPTGNQPLNTQIPIAFNGSNVSGWTVTAAGDDGSSFTTTGSGAAQGAVNVSSAVAGTVTYTVNITTSTRTGLFPRTCAITYEAGAPPPTMYACNGATCEVNPSGTFAEPTCGGTCMVTPPASTCVSYTVTNPMGNNNLIFSHFVCNGVCSLQQPSYAPGTTNTVCVEVPSSSDCSGASTSITVGGNPATIGANGFVLTNTFGLQTGINGATATPGGNAC